MRSAVRRGRRGERSPPEAAGHRGGSVRPLVVTEFTTLDGVVQAPGGPDEDTSGGFAHGGRRGPFFAGTPGARGGPPVRGVRDVVEAVRALRDRDGGELQVHGSPGLVQTLLRADLVDELRLVVAPVVLGEGKRLFGDGAIARSWRLTSSAATPTGVLLCTYSPGGEVETGAMGAEYEDAGNG